MKLIDMILAAALTCTAAQARAEEVITLDLTKSTTPLEFDSDNGAWTGTYNDDCESIDSQCFSFVHSSIGEYRTWWGFTASRSADNSYRENTLTYQFSNMACGGIRLNADGTVMTDGHGAPVCSPEVPYLVGFYNAYFSARPNDLAFTDGKSYRAVGVYVNLNSYTYYSVERGDAYCRAFTNGDRLTLTVHGVDPDGSERTLDVALAESTNGCITLTRGWRYVDLTPLGTVNEIYFTMSSTDSGDYGMNTPGYFCLDKLMVSPVEQVGVNTPTAAGTTISYRRESHTVHLSGCDFALITDAAGRRVLAAEGPDVDIAHLPAGVYVVKAGHQSLKIVK